MNYEEALTWTEIKGCAEPNSAIGKQGLERLHSFFQKMNPESVRKNARLVYAPECFFNDTIKTLESAQDIEHYFSKTLRLLESLSVAFLDDSSSGCDHYALWRMEIITKRLPTKRTFCSFGMSQFRFDAKGRVILHQDFWDSAGNFYAHIPILGSMISLVKRLA
jgi:hypothetical protein